MAKSRYTGKYVRQNMTLGERLAFYTAPPNDRGCMLWVAHLKGTPYGKLKWGRRTQFAHRLAWEHANGPIPDGLKVLHRCDVPKCVNPEHLFIGTQIENIADRDAKGRTARGAALGLAVRAGLAKRR
jgi:hypothetical protein